MLVVFTKDVSGVVWVRSPLAGTTVMLLSDEDALVVLYRRCVRLCIVEGRGTVEGIEFGCLAVFMAPVRTLSVVVALKSCFLSCLPHPYLVRRLF